MFTQVTVQCRVVFDVVEWYARATWLDDPDAELVIIEKSGTARCHPYAAPAEIGRACLDQWATDDARERLERA